MTWPQTNVVRPSPLLLELLACAAILVAALWVGIPRHLDGIDLADEGFVAYGAMRVLAGELPQRDFVSVQPPLSFYSIAALFALCGPSLVALRQLGLATHVAIALLVYAIARQRVGLPSALIAALPATAVGLPLFLFVPFAMWQGMVLHLVAALALLRFGASGSAGWAIGAGIATGLGVVCRHDQGALLVLAVFAYAAVLRMAPEHPRATPERLVALWLGAAAATMLPLVGFWGAAGAWPEMFRQLVVFPLSIYAKTSGIPMPWFAPRAGQDVSTGWQVAAFYLPLAVQAAVAAALRARALAGRPRAGDAGRAFVLALSITFYFQVLTRSDVRHLLITLPPLFALAGICIDEAVRSCVRIGSRLLRRRPDDFAVQGTARAAVWVALAVLASRAIPVLSPVVFPHFGTPREAVGGERGGVSLMWRDARFLNRLTETISRLSEPEQSILALPYEPMLYFLSERRNPMRWNYLWPGDQSEEDHRQLVAEARGDPPALVVLKDPDAMRRYAAPVVDYVETEFVPFWRAGAFRLYRRRDAPPANLTDAE